MADWVGSPRFPATGSSSGVPSRGSTSCWSDAFPCLCTWADVLHCSGLRSGATDLLCPLLTPVRRSGSVSRSSASFTRTRVPKAPDRPPGVRHVTVAARAPDLQNASQPQMEGFAVTCPLAPDASRLISGFCSSPRSFGFGFLQTPPRDDALAVSLAFGSANTWLPDFHRHSYVPCPAHTPAPESGQGGPPRLRRQRWLPRQRRNCPAACVLRRPDGLGGSRECPGPTAKDFLH
jgi:hypothetical protein